MADGRAQTAAGLWASLATGAAVFQIRSGIDTGPITVGAAAGTSGNALSAAADLIGAADGAAFATVLRIGV